MFKCTECGTEYPDKTDGGICIVCGARLPFRWCTKCYRLYPVSNYTLTGGCRVCRKRALVDVSHKSKVQMQAQDKRLAHFNAVTRGKLLDYLTWWSENLEANKEQLKLTASRKTKTRNAFETCVYCDEEPVTFKPLLETKYGGYALFGCVVPVCTKHTRARHHADISEIEYIFLEYYKNKRCGFRDLSIKVNRAFEILDRLLLEEGIVFNVKMKPER